MDLFILDKTVFDQKIAELRNTPAGERNIVEYPNLYGAIEGEEQSGEGNGFDPNDPGGSGDYLDGLMYELQTLGVLRTAPGSPELYIASTLDTEGYRQISVGGLHLPVIFGGIYEKAWHLTDDGVLGVAGVWAAAEAAVAEANRISDGVSEAATMLAEALNNTSQAE